MHFFRNLLFLLFLIYSGSCFGNSIETQSKISQYISKGQYDSAEVYIQSELKKTLSDKRIIDLNHQLVSVYIYSSKYKDALDIAFKTIDRIDTENEKSRFYFLIACIFYSVQDYEKSIDYFDLQLESDNPSLNAKALLILSDVYSTQKKDSKASEALKKADELCRNSKVDSKLSTQVSLQYNLHIKDYEACKQICETMIADSSSFLNTRCNAFTTIGDCLMQQDSTTKAIAYYEKALKLTIETNDPDLIKTTSSLLIKAYEQIGDQEKANSYHKIYNDAINDSAYFSIDKYRELYALENARSVEKSKAKTKESKLYLWLILIALGIGIFLVSIFVYRKKKAQLNQEEKVQSPSKKIQINPEELKKIEQSVNVLISSQLFLEPNITRKSFCEKNDVKSERYLSQFINDRYEKSFTVFINELRAEYAYDRLKSEKLFRNYKTSEIAKSSGFGSVKTFERVFLAKYNQTPFDFINSISN